MTTTTFPVRVWGDDHGFRQSSTAMIVEVRGPNRALVDSQMVWVNGPPANLRLGEPGPHSVRATLASGKVLYEDLEYNGVTTPTVDFSLNEESPHETLQRTGSVYRLTGRQIGNLAAPRYLSSWVRLWARRSDGWETASPDLDLEGTEWHGDAVRYTFRLGRFQHALEIGAPGVAPLVVALPSVGVTEVVVRPIAETGRHPFEVLVVPGSPQAATLLGFLANGAVEATEDMFADDADMARLAAGADMLGDDHFEPNAADLAEMVLYKKVSDPNTAALGAYHLLRIGDLDRLHSWPANLANWMTWLADGPIIRGWQLLRGGTAREDETPRARFLEAVDRGIPVYAEGLRLLIDGLKVVERENPDEELRSAIDRMGAYAGATDWSRPVLTFTGNGPDRPHTFAIPSAGAGLAGTMMLHSVTVDDLVAHGLLRHGTHLHTEPRTARRIDASWTDQAVVTADGMLDTNFGPYSDPNEAAIQTQRDLTDGWHMWLTPDGTTLDTLRRQARMRPPVPESELLAEPIAKKGLPTRAVNRLAAVDIESVADLLNFGLDRIETIPGIGEATARSVRQAFDERGLSISSPDSV